MSKSAQKREALLDELADYLLTHGLAAAQLRPMARAVGTSDRMLLYYFQDKDELIAAALSRVADRWRVLLDAQASGEKQTQDVLIERMKPLLLNPAVAPYMSLFLECAAGAARGNELFRKIGGEIGGGLHKWAASQLDSPDPETDAAQLLTLVEGAVMLNSLGLRDIALKGLG